MSSRSARLVRTNVFVDPKRPLYSGNPGVAVLVSEHPPAEMMQRFAQDMGVAGTAFVVSEGDEHHLRLFTPSVEIDFSGHTSMAAAHALHVEGHLSSTSRLHCRVGELSPLAIAGGFELSCPIDRPEPSAAPESLIPALGVQPVRVCRGRFDYLVEVETPSDVRELNVDVQGLSRVDTRGVVVTARTRDSSDGEFDFVSRFFAPRAGIDEDAVTGSAHCQLAPYWTERIGRAELTAYQASARGGIVRMRLEGDTVVLGGATRTVIQGDLTADLSEES